MKKIISLVLLILFIAGAVLSGGCTAFDPGETLYLDELYGSTPTQTPVGSDTGDIDAIPDDVEKIEDHKEW